MKPMNRLSTVATATALAASALLAAAPAQAAQPAPLLAEDSASSICTVTGGSLAWGVKDSFRSYITGTIANGEITAGDGAAYEAPVFNWTGATGEVDAETGKGTVSFAGWIHFTGHDGVLDLQLSNPTVELRGDGTASLLLDTKSNDMQGDVAIEAQQAFIGKAEGIGTIDPSSGSVAISNAPVVLASEGAEAFGGGSFYSSGDELDPINLELQLGPCEGTPASTVEDQPADEEPAVEAPAEPETAEQGLPWLPIGIGAVALVVIGVSAGMLISGRKKGAAE